MKGNSLGKEEVCREDHLRHRKQDVKRPKLEKMWD